MHVEEGSADGEADAAAEHAGLGDGASTLIIMVAAEKESPAPRPKTAWYVQWAAAPGRAPESVIEADAEQLEARGADERVRRVVAPAREGAAEERAGGAGAEQGEDVDAGHEHALAVDHLETLGVDDAEADVGEAGEQREPTRREPSAQPGGETYSRPAT